MRLWSLSSESEIIQLFPGGGLILSAAPLQSRAGDERNVLLSNLAKEKLNFGLQGTGKGSSRSSLSFVACENQRGANRRWGYIGTEKICRRQSLSEVAPIIGD